MLGPYRIDRKIGRGGMAMGMEAWVREHFMAERAEALRLLAEYLVANPGHRAGLGRSPSWWWASMRSDPRFRQIVGLP